MTDGDQQQSSKPRRRWLRFSLSTLLVITAVAAACFGWLAREISRARSEERTLAELANVIGGGQLNVLYGDRFQSEDELFMEDFGPENTGVRGWLENHLGIDPFRTVKSITIYGVGNGFSYGVDQNRMMTVQATYVSGLDDQHAEMLLEFPYLKMLMLEGNPISDAGVEHLSGLAQLEFVHLGNTAITDEGVPVIASLPKLKHLHLGHTIVTDRALEALEDCQLESLDVEVTNVSKEALAAFQKRHPGCEF